MKFKCICYIISAFLMLSCATSKSLVDTNVMSIEFGYSGGFTNQHTQKILDNTGCLYKVSGGEKELVCKVDDDTVRAIFKESSQLEGTVCDAGNISYYIVVRRKNGDTKWIWNKSTKDIDSLWSLYKKLNELK